MTGNWLMTGGILTAATAAWGQVQGWFRRVYGFAIVTVELEGWAVEVVSELLWDEFRWLKTGNVRYNVVSAWIRPLGRKAMVGFTQPCEGMTFLRGWRPIFVTVPKSKGENNNFNYADHLMKLTFVRGTFDAEKLLIEALDRRNSKDPSGGEVQHSNRYRVHRVYGTAMRRKGAYQNDGTVEGSRSPNGEQAQTSGSTKNKPLVWREEDIGPPLADSPFKNLSLEPQVERFVDEIRQWYKSGEFFKNRSIPWRMAAALYGPPGTGKTSLARAVAQELQIPIYMIDLTTLDNEELVEHWQKILCNAPCMVLFEDIDRLFGPTGEFLPADREERPLTLDTLLQCISGVEPTEGLLILATANKPDRLDPALMRAGRLERSLLLDVLDENGRRKIAARILEGWSDLIEVATREGKGESGAAFEHRCARMAVERFWQDSTRPGRRFKNGEVMYPC